MEDEIAFLAWELAGWQRNETILRDDETRALVLLILLALVSMRQGNTRVARSADSRRATSLEFANRLLADLPPAGELDPLTPHRAAELMNALVESGKASALIGTASDFKPLIVAGDQLYLQKLIHLENQLVADLRRCLEAKVRGWSDQAIDGALGDVLGRPVLREDGPVELTVEQCEAVRASLQSNVTIISGGPGTGKTTIVLSILRTLVRLGVECEDIALCAPTGKAAARLGAAIRIGPEGIAKPAPADGSLVLLAEPRTVHRLLGYSPTDGRFHHHENNRLAERVVIVDEASMIDLALLERLIRSLRDDGRLILLGDAHQLPAVEAGAALRDLLAAGEQDPRRGPRAVRLRQSHRLRALDPNGRNLLHAAASIQEGKAPRFDTARSGDDVIVARDLVADLNFQGIEFVSLRERPEILHVFLDRWTEEAPRPPSDLAELIGHDYVIAGDAFRDDDQKRLRQLFDYWERFRVLSLTRVLATGTDRINALLHERTLRKLEQRGDDDLLAGEPVMMQVNDYQRMIFNGDQGVILNVADRGWGKAAPMAVFRRSSGFAAFHLELLRSSLVLSYAMTVHKAQGSEFDRVALVLPDRDLPINTREILYTALTRARSSAVILGDREIFEAGIKKMSDRDSGIAEKLLA
jgi:exodeoxyribonuclease V alpha subunit